GHESGPSSPGFANATGWIGCRRARRARYARLTSCHALVMSERGAARTGEVEDGECAGARIRDDRHRQDGRVVVESIRRRPGPLRPDGTPSDAADLRARALRRPHELPRHPAAPRCARRLERRLLRVRATARLATA